jgi:hypothetical protein
MRLLRRLLISAAKALRHNPIILRSEFLHDAKQSESLRLPVNVVQMRVEA